METTDELSPPCSQEDVVLASHSHQYLLRHFPPKATEVLHRFGSYVEAAHRNDLQTFMTVYSL